EATEPPDATAPVTAVGAPMGTPGFIAPELALGQLGEVDGRTDIFALGATLFRVFTGQYVHGAATTPTKLDVHAATRPARSIGSLLPELAPPAIALIDRALCFEKSDRWPSAAAMRSELRRAFPALASPTSAAATPAKPGPLTRRKLVL